MNRLEGQRFGRLSVDARAEIHRKNGDVEAGWRCRCDCGAVCTKSTNDLLGKGTSRCCRKCPLPCTRHDLVGRRYGTLEVISFVERRQKRHYWRCRCDCGNEVTLHPMQFSSRCCRERNCGVKCPLRKTARGSENRQWTGGTRLSGKYLTRLKRNARLRGLQVEASISTASLEDIFDRQGGRCALTGVEIALLASERTEATASIDRIDSQQGYALDNIQWVHKTVNEMKNNQTETEFRYWCSKVAQHAQVRDQLHPARS